MPDYTKGKTYMICSPHTNKVYIGSTTETLTKRFRGHKNDKGYCSSRELIDFGDAEIKLVYLCPCYTKEELKHQEGRVMKLFKNRINKLMEGQTKEELRDRRNQKSREVYAANRDEINEKSRNMPQEHKDKRNEKAREVYAANKDKVLKKAREVYAANKDKIKKSSGSTLG